jgi:hypothetical protein
MINLPSILPARRLRVNGLVDGAITFWRKEGGLQPRSQGLSFGGLEADDEDTTAK